MPNSVYSFVHVTTVFLYHELIYLFIFLIGVLHRTEEYFTNGQREQGSAHKETHRFDAQVALKRQYRPGEEAG